MKSGSGRVVAKLANRSTSLFCRMSVHCCASRLSDSWPVAGNLAHRDRLALDDLGGHLSEVHVWRLTVGVRGAIVHYGFIVQGNGRFGGSNFCCDVQAH